MPALVPSDRFYEVVTSTLSSKQTKLDLIESLKNHVKRDTVRTSDARKYFDALGIAINMEDGNIGDVSFNVICHLVRRVSVQEEHSGLLKEQSVLLLPIILTKLGSSDSRARIRARKALENYWLSAHDRVNKAIIEEGFTSSDTVVVLECISFLEHIIALNPNFPLDQHFNPGLIQLLEKNSQNHEIVRAVKSYVKKFYSSRNNRKYKYDFQQMLEESKIPTTEKQAILALLVDSFDVTKKPVQKQPFRATPPAIERSSSRPSSRPSSRASRPASRIGSSNSSNVSEVQLIPATVLTSESSKLVSKIPNYALDKSIQPIKFTQADQLYHKVSEILPAFIDKETEFNWSTREKHIITLRAIFRGNYPEAFPSDTIACIKEASDGICKAITSLRTTLSSNGCQLIKELAIILKSSFDPLTDIFLPTLMKLCSATKHIASTNSNMAISSIFMNVTYSHKWFTKVLAASNEKNVNPRSYSGLWVQIALTRFANTEAFNAPHGTQSMTGLEISKKVVSKLLADANPTVRQAAKDAYWCLWLFYKTEAEALLSTFEPYVIKGVEKSKPNNFDTHKSSLLTTRSRPSIREEIMAKNKELRAKQESRPSSRITARPSVENIESKVRKPTPDIKLVPRATQRSSSVREKPEELPVHREISDYSDSFKSESRLQKSFESKQSFDIDKDPILRFLSSDNKEEGIHLLKYAIVNDEELSKETNILLRKVSLEQPEVLRPLLINGETLFKKTSKFLSVDDLLRVCTLIVEPTKDNAEYIISCLEADEIYDAAVKLLSDITNVKNIIDDHLSMQIIKNKDKLVSLLIEFLDHFIGRIPLKDRIYVGLITVLFDFVVLTRSSPAFASCGELLKLLYSINQPLFIDELKMVNDVNREEIEDLVGIDRAFELTSFSNVGSLSELTRILPGKITSVSPLKNPSDFTMLIPSRRAGPDSTIVFNSKPKKEKSVEPMEVDVDINTVPAFDKEVEDNIDVDEVEAVSHTVTSQSNVFNSPSPNNSQIFSKFTSGRASAELAEEFAQVEISEEFAQVEIDQEFNHPVSNKASIQSFIDRVDPLSQISSKNKHINIFSDDVAGSPQKVKAYNFTNVNWFNTQLTRLAHDVKMKESFTPSRFEYLCERMLLKLIEKDELGVLFYHLQLRNTEFILYYESKGSVLMEESVWAFFEGDIQEFSHDLYQGLMIINQLVVNGTRINSEKLWQCLVSLSSLPCPAEFQMAINETYNEVLGLYPTSNLLSYCITSLNEQKLLVFVLECLLSILGMNSFNLVFEDDLVRQIDEALSKYMKHEETEVRRHVILIYGRLLKASRIFNNSDEKNIMDTVLQKFPFTQKKLVEYYSHE